MIPGINFNQSTCMIIENNCALVDLCELLLRDIKNRFIVKSLFRQILK